MTRPEQIVGWIGRPIYCDRCKKSHAFYRPAGAYQPIPLIDHLKDAGEIVLGVVVLLVLFIGLPLLIYIGAS
jgi:hypothetical protein